MEKEGRKEKVVSSLTFKVTKHNLDDHHLVGRFGENSFTEQKLE